MVQRYEFAASPIQIFPGDAITKAPSAVELLVINLKNSSNSEVSPSLCTLPLLWLTATVSTLSA
jgi:hypothetical protein